MGKIDLSINKVGLEHNIQKAKENNVIIPTIAQMQHPETIPEKGHLMVVPDIPNDDSPEVIDWIQTYMEWMDGVLRKRRTLQQVLLPLFLSHDTLQAG